MFPYFLFATGIENSYPTIDNGKKRVDEMEKCRHYKIGVRTSTWSQDLGISFLRYGPPIHKTWLGHDKYDWTFADTTFHDLRKRDIVVITRPVPFRRSGLDRKFPEPRLPGTVRGLRRSLCRAVSVGAVVHADQRDVRLRGVLRPVRMVERAGHYATAPS